MAIQPQQRDYHGDAQLVPGTLTAYRHFHVQTHERAWNTGRHEPIGRPRLISMNGRTAPYTDAGPVAVAARCSGLFRTSVGKDKKSPPKDHKSPHVDCSCGFYAHYSPETDFYPAAGWGDPALGDEVFTWSWYDSDTHNPITNRATNRLIHYIDPYIMVRAVVELSGTIVMGSRGVRAERMRVKALAVDWDKFVPMQMVTRTELEMVTRAEPEWVDIMTFGDTDTWRLKIDAPKTEVAEAVAGDPKPEEIQRFNGQVRELARLHGAEFYEDAQEMYRAHPQPDLSALGVEPAPPNDEQVMEALQKAWAAVAAQTAQTHSSMQRLLASLRKALGVTDPDASAFQRAIEAKKNRPAPPGTGIDYRKKKL